MQIFRCGTKTCRHHWQFAFRLMAPILPDSFNIGSDHQLSFGKRPGPVRTFTDIGFKPRLWVAVALKELDYGK